MHESMYFLCYTVCADEPNTNSCLKRTIKLIKYNESVSDFVLHVYSEIYHLIILMYHVCSDKKQHKTPKNQLIHTFCYSF